VVKIKNQVFKPVAVIGYGCVFPPDSYDVKKFWENVLSGKSGIMTTPEERWKWEYYYDKDRNAEDKTYCRLGGCIKDYAFPSEKYKLSGDELKKLNRTQLLLLDTVLQALEKAGIPQDGFRNSQTGVFVGNMLGDEAFSDYSINLRAQEFYHYLNNDPEYLRLADDTKEEIRHKFFKVVDEKFKKLDKENYESILHSALGKAVCNFLGVKGSAIIVDSACSAGVLVIDEAIKHLQNNKLKTCITSAVLGNMNVTGNVAFAKIGGISPSHSSPLDHKANGLIPGEGAGTIILKSLENAIKDGDRIYAVIRGVGSASDGKGKSIYAPSSLGQVTAMRKSLLRAGLNPGEIEYIETHATATPVGDKVELNTLKMLYENEDLPKQSVALGSIKSQIGHSFSAAGMANLVKVIEGMQQNIMPPTHNYEKTADEVKLEDSPFYINTIARQWPVRKQGEPKRACVNAFGFGGINASIVVEEYLEDYHQQLLNRLRQTGTETPGALDVAIVGVGVIDSCAVGKSEWWEKAGASKIRSGFPENRWNKEINGIFDLERKYEGSFIEKMDFPFMKYKIPPIVLPEIDKGQQMALMAAGEAIYEYGQEKIEPAKTGIYVGAMLGLESSVMADLRIRIVEYLEIIKQIPEFISLPQNVQKAIIENIRARFRSYIPKVGEDTLPGYMDNIIAGRIANFFNINGTNVVIDSDTTSFMSALEQGIMSLVSGENNTIIVGGVHANMTPEFLGLFEALKDKVKDECPRCKIGMGGFVPAEGAVFLILKNYQDLKPGETVYARIKGLINEPGFEQKVRFGVVAGDKAADIQEYALCCNGLVNPAAKRQFYFGAQAGFTMLKAILALHHGEYKHLAKAGASGNNGSHLTGIYAHSVLGGDYLLLLDTAGTDAKLEFDCGIDQDKSQIAGPFPNFTLYLSDDNWDKLLSRINTVLEGDKIESDTIEEMQKCNYRLAVVYKSLEELRRKLKAVS
jgi:acyl transferase domain-containing protein